MPPHRAFTPDRRVAAARLALAGCVLAAVGLELEAGSGHLAVAGAMACVGLAIDRLIIRLSRALADAEAGALHFDLAGDMLCTANAEGRFVDLNGRWEETLGWTREQLLAQPFVEFVHPDDRARTHAEAGAIAVGDCTVDFTNRYRTADGGYRHLEWRSRLDRRRGLIYAAARDVTARHDAEAGWRAAERRFRGVFEDAHLAIAVVGVHGESTNRIIEANEALSHLLGWPREELVGMFTPTRCARPEDEAHVRVLMAELASGERHRVRLELPILRRDGSTVWVELNTTTLLDDDGRPLYRLTMLVDITDRRRYEQELRALADFDPLTGVLNRRRFAADFEEELRRGGRGAVLVLDLDRFKGVNDTLGHEAGDHLIRTVAQAMEQRLRSGDLLARLGGDEFAVLLRRVGPMEAQEVAHDLVTTVEAAARAEVPAELAISASIGVAPFDGHGEVDQLLRVADAAMYEAKGVGGACAAGAEPHRAVALAGRGR